MGKGLVSCFFDSEEELIKRLNEWKENVQSKGVRVVHVC